VADSGRSADVDPRRLSTRPAVPETCRFPSTTIYNLLGSSSRYWLLLTVCCVSRLIETRCLVCRVRCTYSLPPTLGVVYASLIPTCPRICVCSMYSMALVASCGVLRMVLRLCRPERLAKMRFRRSLYLLQRRMTWATVCRLSPQLQRGLVTVGTCRLKRKSLSPIFSVRSCSRLWCSSDLALFSDALSCRITECAPGDSIIRNAPPSEVPLGEREVYPTSSR
jgi:hypothetical protein